MKKIPSKADFQFPSNGPKILHPQTQESVTLANIFLLQGSNLFQDTYGFFPNNYTFLKGSPREKACIMHFLLMIADYYEAKQQFAFLEPEKDTGLIRFGTADLPIFRDRAYTIAAALSNMAGFELMPQSEFLGFSSKCMNMLFRLSLYCLQEQSKRLLRRLSFKESVTDTSQVVSYPGTKSNLSVATFFDETMNPANDMQVTQQEPLQNTAPGKDFSEASFPLISITPYCGTRIALLSEELDIDTLLAERIADIYRELLYSRKDNSYYQMVIQCLLRHNYEMQSSKSGNIPRTLPNTVLENALSLLQDLCHKINEIPSVAYRLSLPSNTTETVNLHEENPEFNEFYPDIDIAKLRELHLTNLQSTSANFALVCTGATELLRKLQTHDSLLNVQKGIFTQKELGAVQSYGVFNHNYNEQLSNIKNSIKTLQAQIDALNEDIKSEPRHFIPVADDAFTTVLLDVLDPTQNGSSVNYQQSNHRIPNSVANINALDSQMLNESLKITMKSQITDKLSQKLQGVFSGKNQEIPVTTLILDGKEGQLLQAVHVGDD